MVTAHARASTLALFCRDGFPLCNGCFATVLTGGVAQDEQVAAWSMAPSRPPQWVWLPEPGPCECPWCDQPPPDEAGGFGTLAGSEVRDGIAMYGAVKTRTATALSAGQWAGSVAFCIGREISNSVSHFGQRNRYTGIWQIHGPAFANMRKIAFARIRKRRSQTG